MSLVSLLLAVGLAAVHVFAGRLRVLDHVPRSRWLSFASGLSVAYVFLHLLPEVAAGQRVLRQTAVAGPGQVDTHLWLVTLLGLVVFYGLERAAKTSRQRPSQARGGQGTEPKVFWLHIVSFGLYNVLVGYLLMHRLEEGLGNLLMFWLAMALHFVVNDHGLRGHHRERYTRIGRWLLAAGVLVGYSVGLVVELRELTIALLIAFLGGGVVLNVLKEELPEERESRFVPFVVGAAAYAALLTAM